MIDVLKGKPVSDSIMKFVEEKLASFDGASPVLAIIRVGEKPEDMSYEKNAVKRLAETGIKTVRAAFPEDINPEELKKQFTVLNDDDEIDGILVLRPFPAHLRDAERWMEKNIRS